MVHLTFHFINLMRHFFVRLLVFHWHFIQLLKLFKQLSLQYRRPRLLRDVLFHFKRIFSNSNFRHLIKRLLWSSNLQPFHGFLLRFSCDQRPVSKRSSLFFNDLIQLAFRWRRGLMHIHHLITISKSRRTVLSPWSDYLLGRKGTLDIKSIIQLSFKLVYRRTCLVSSFYVQIGNICSRNMLR